MKYLASIERLEKTVLRGHERVKRRGHNVGTRIENLTWYARRLTPQSSRAPRRSGARACSVDGRTSVYRNERKPSANLLGRGSGRLCPLPERSQSSGDGTAAITVHSVVRRWWRVPSSRAVPSKNPGGRRSRSEWECAHAHSQAVEEIVALGSSCSSVVSVTGDGDIIY